MKNFKNIFSLLTATLVSQLMFSQTQTGPGGVGDASTIAFWLDASQLGLNNGDPVATWTDVSGNGNDFSQGVVSNRPTFVQTSSLNGHPAVSFDGSTHYMEIGGIAMMNNNRYSFYTVSKLPSPSSMGTSQQRTILEGNYSSISPFTVVFYRRDNNVNSRIFGASKSVSSYALPTIQFPTNQLAEIKLNSYRHLSNDDVVIVSNGLSNTVSGANEPIGTNDGFALGRRLISGQFFIGEMNDIVAYNTPLNNAQDIILQNFLSAKYSTSIGAFLRYNNASTHPNELAGVGRENASNEHLSAKGTGIVEVIAASLDDNDYLLWAHDNGVLTSQTSNIPAGYVTSVGEVMTRTWRVTETGESGDLTFVFDMTGIQFGNPNDYQLLIDNDGDFTNGGTTQIDGVLVGDELTFTVLGAQLSDGNYFTIGNSKESIIRSIADEQDWGDPTTWSCNCIPGATSEFVTIVDGHTVTVSNAQAILDLTVQPTGVLAISSTGVLDVHGDLTINGTINSDVEGTLNFIGASAQSITATGTQEIGGLTLNNANGLTLVSGIYNFNGIFTPTSGNMDFGDNDITFVSNASGTAVIGTTGAGASFSGMSNFKVQRFIPSGVAGFRDIGSPLTSMPLSQWDDEIFISGAGFPDGCPLTETGCYHSATYWDASLQAYRTVNNIDSNITSGSALEIYLGDNLNSFAGRALTATGIPNTSLSVDIPIQNGWNLISNPFLSPIDFDNITRNGSTGNYFYVYDPSTSSFQYWDGINQLASVSHFDNGILASSQGFWVFHSGASSTITVNQGSKSVNAADQYLRSNGTFSPQNNLYFELSSPSGNQKAIGSVKMYDAWKSNEVSNLPLLSPPNLETVSIYTADENGNEYVVNNVNKEEDCFSMPVFVDVLRTGDYSIDFKNPGTEFEIYVKNNLSGESSRLYQDTKFEFRVDGVIKKVNPFNLEFKKVNPCIVDGITNEVFEVFASLDQIFISSEQPIDKDLTISVVNTLGAKVIKNVIMNKEATNISINSNGLSGLYLVSISDLNGNVVKVEKVFLNK